ncbi:Hint domain-containing protein [Litoreibacter janthinus]|uniref:Hint domain-containing protein n=1 Tax=Litoreibacter janthinus TaxID=670154 RepID=A0A1I6GGT0_9RHOB|nr:Hint domain-containing protein [Litoreibacter janthinus]SFR41402.1 Hint domain-containing protein [Litoreibacter janthinus]
MTYNPNVPSHLAPSQVGIGHSIVYRAAAQPRTRAMSRPYNIAWLTPDGNARYDTVVAPALPAIESACANMARGAIVSTDNGPVAVEDLTPGMRILSSEYGAIPLQWIGSYEMSLREAQTADRGALLRVTAEAFGLAKPSQDLLLAPRAHILLRHAKCRSLFGVDIAFAPVRAFEDGISVFSVQPASPVTVYNLGFDRQATIKVNGIEMESFHPGPHSEALLDDEMLYSLLRLFPQARNLDFFGTQLINRLTTFEVKALRGGS